MAKTNLQLIDKNERVLALEGVCKYSTVDFKTYEPCIFNEKGKLYGNQYKTNLEFNDFSIGWEIKIESLNDFKFQKEYKLSLKVNKNNLQGYLDKKLFLEFNDIDSPLNYGGIGFVVESGTQSTDEIIVG